MRIYEMRILDVSPRVSYPPDRGSSVRTYNLLLGLSRDHEVAQFSQARPARGHDERPFEEMQINASYRELRYRPRLAGLVGEAAERSWVRAPLLSGVVLELARPSLLDELLAWADVVLVEFPWQFYYCRRRFPDRPVVLVAHNVEAPKFASYARAAEASPGRRLWVRHVRRMEAHAVARAELVCAVSESDRLGLIERYRADPARVLTVPNGADTDRYAPVTPGEREAAKRRLGLPPRTTVIYAGSDVPPNWAGLAWVRRLAAVAPQFTFLVVGALSPPGVWGNFVATGLVDDFASYLAAADLSLCPIEHGGGTKIKLLESLAAGLPTVAFAEALEGLDLRDGEHLLVAGKSERSLLQALNHLRLDGALAKRLRCAGRRHVEDRHAWAVIARHLERALAELLPITPTTARGQPSFAPCRAPAAASTPGRREAPEHSSELDRPPRPPA
jgi:glycosyltransferase involved in cell wall biosynthesis